ncbi:hypothetical protein WJX74_008666 [Apatococcus lobatus]|uniref:Uncharacterized protein n=1 Tax=Apatococcus lobatus TaxID=904363 RepID=A0AAW1RCE7_9CHLO
MMVTILPLPAPVQAPLSAPSGRTGTFQAAKYFTIIFFVASVGVVIIIALSMFCRCCSRWRSSVQPLGPNIPLGSRRDNSPTAVQPVEPMAEIVRKRGVIVEHPAGDMGMALRDVSVSSMKHPALAKESASYTTLEMPTDIVIIPVGPLSCPAPDDASSSAQSPCQPSAFSVQREPSYLTQSGHGSAQNGSTFQVDDPGLLDTAAIAGILDTAAELPVQVAVTETGTTPAQQQETQHAALTGDPPGRSRWQSAEAGLGAEQAASLASHGQAFVSTPGALPAHHVSGMEGRAQENQHDMLDTSTSIQGLLSTQ